jgi:inorganic pyrophosphatase
MNLYDIPIHKNSPIVVNAIVEIPKGTRAKYEYDKDYEVFKLDRCLTSAMAYPANYGFIPKTLGEDNDPLDIIIYNDIAIEMGSLVECKIVGMLDMVDGGENDHKIVGVPVYHSRVNEYNSIEDLDDLFLKITENFFLHYKDLNDKEVQINGWCEPHKAKEVIDRSIIGNCSSKAYKAPVNFGELEL